MKVKLQSDIIRTNKKRLLNKLRLDLFEHSLNIIYVI